MYIPTLETARLRLVAPAEAHVDALFAMYSDDETTRHIPHTRTATPTAAWFKVATQLGHWHLRGYGFWVVVERAGGDVVGNAGLLYPAGNPSLEVGWLIARPHWRKGYAYEAVLAILRFAFDRVGADSVIAHVPPANVASLALADKLGMRRDDAASTAEATILCARPVVSVLRRADRRYE